MKRSIFAEEQIIGILRQTEAGVRVVDLRRQNGIQDAIFYKQRSKFGGMNIPDTKRLRQLEEETTRLKILVGEQALDIVVLKGLISKNFCSPQPRGQPYITFWLRMATQDGGLAE